MRGSDPVVDAWNFRRVQQARRRQQLEDHESRHSGKDGPAARRPSLTDPVQRDGEEHRGERRVIAVHVADGDQALRAGEHVGREGAGGQKKRQDVAGNVSHTEVPFPTRL